MQTKNTENTVSKNAIVALAIVNALFAFVAPDAGSLDSLFFASFFFCAYFSSAWSYSAVARSNCSCCILLRVARSSSDFSIAATSVSEALSRRFDTSFSLSRNFSGGVCIIFSICLSVSVICWSISASFALAEFKYSMRELIWLIFSRSACIWRVCSSLLSIA